MPHPAGGGWSVTETRPTLDTVAEAAGVSRMTVSNAYNRPNQLSPATRQHVLEVAARLGYAGPDPAGASLRRGRVGAVGVVLTERLGYAFTDPGLVSFMQGLAAELGAGGQAMLLVPTEANSDGSFVRNAIVDAFIISAMEADDPNVAAVVGRRLPIVTAGSPRLAGVPHVGIDNKKAGELVADHFLALGHRTFTVVTLSMRDTRDPATAELPARPGVRQRVEGFVSRLRAAGVGLTDIAIVSAAANTSAAAAAAIGDVLNGPASRRPSAVFGVTDVLALGVLQAARAASLVVPDQLSVAGFDDINAAAHSTPALTTVSQSLFEQGQEVAHMTLGLLRGESVRSPRIKAELIVRDSTAAPPAAKRGRR